MGKRSRFAGEPFSDDDAAIASYLEDLSVPTLMASMVSLTGDPSWIRGELRPLGIYLNEVQGFMEPASLASIRAAALQAIVAFRDGDGELPAPPSPEIVHEIMEFLVATPVDPAYLEMMLEELELDGIDHRQPHPNPAVPASVREGLPVLVVGAGMSGILAGIRLSQAGFPFRIVEKNEGAGGTWFENRYPGCRVDVGNHFYCYSFAPNDDWSAFFATAPELRAYLQGCAQEAGILDKTSFSTEMLSASWDETSQTWQACLQTPDGEEVVNVAAIVSAVGQLNRPKLPAIDGLDRFKGESMHSAAWHEGIDLKGKRVAVVGSGASAFQIVPTIADELAQLTVFQRSAPWMFPNPSYHDAVGAGVSWAMRHLPHYGRWYRFLIFWPSFDGGLEAMRIDPEWPHPERATNELNDAARQMFTEWILSQVEGDEELAAKVIPDYVCLGKRTLQDNGSWLSALRREHVELETTGIQEINEQGIVTSDGRQHDFDIIIYATGFQANKFLWPMEIKGRDGTLLSEQWGIKPTALYGIVTPNFPNLFCLYGPGTNLAHGGSLILNSECEMRYIIGCLQLLEAQGGGSIEVTQDAHDLYNEKLRDELSRMIWTHPSIKSSWYQNEDGEVYILSPWRNIDFWTWTKEPKPSDFSLSAPR
ncbi:MAG: NAD(P)/FAD-dependent oxidoreductase [Actinomycetota bacterium]